MAKEFLDKKEYINGENMNIPKVSIIILNWNGWEDTLECLESVYQITYSNYDVIVVDNGSEDESIGKIKEYTKGKIYVESKFFKYNSNNKPIKTIEYIREEVKAGGVKKEEITNLPSNKKMIIIKNEKNYGFAEGNNIAMEYALKALNPDYILLLNNDTVVDPKFLGELTKVAESDPKIGIVGPKIYYYNYKGREDVIWFAGGKIHWRLGKTAHLHMENIDNGNINKLMQVDYITGCAILLNRNLLDKIGLLDPDYFAYFEEVDLCARASKFYNCIFVPKAKIWHKVSRSTGGNFSPTMAYLFIRNKMLFMMKNGPKSMKNRFIFLGFHSEYSIRKLIKYLLIGNKEIVKSIYSGFIDSLKIFHRFLLIFFLLF